MAVSRLSAAGGANDFNVAITDTHTSVTFTKEYAPGAYTITSTGNDTTFDIYAYSGNGALAGYTNTPALTTSIGFNKLVIIGHTAGILLSFTYKTTYTTVTDNDEVTAGPFITSATSTSLPNIDSSTTVTGGNFASNITATFTGTGYTETSAKSVTRNSVTSVTVVRPDSLPISGSPYTLKFSNTGVTNPTGSNSHLLTVTAGSAPVWNTAATLSTRYTKNVSYTTTLSATDPDGGTITYTSVGAMPTGLTINSTSGVVAGTSSASTTLTFTIRATDTGGNAVDRTFTLLNQLPVWSTTSFTAVVEGSSVSVQVTATDDGTIAYSLLSGSLPSGLSINSSGLITGTASTPQTASFTLRVTDDAGGTADQALTWLVQPGVGFLVLGGGAGGGGGSATPNNRQGGGGGAGGLRTSFGAESGRDSSPESPLAISTGTNYTVTVGGGAGWSSGSNSNGGNGGSSTFASITAQGGGGGGFSAGGSGNSGGCGGGGGSQGFSGGAGTANQGHNGADSAGSNSGGCGGGAGTYINQTTDGSGTAFSSSITGSAASYSRGGEGTQGVGASGYGGGGAGSYEGGNGTNGNTGVVILRYNSTLTCSIGAGLSGSTANLGNGNKVTTITSGSGNVSWS